MISAPTGGTYRSIGSYQLPRSIYDQNFKHTNFSEKYKLTNTLSDYGAITNIAVNNQNGNFATTSGYNIGFYNGSTFNLEKKISDFRQNCYGGSFKSNGQLYACGSGEGVIRMYQTTNFKSLGKSALRKFYRKGSSQEQNLKVRIVKFYENGSQSSRNGNKILGFYDDGNICKFDVPTTEMESKFSLHSERIQTCDVSENNIYATGSYDKTVKIWSSDFSEAVSTLTLKNPVESILWVGNTNLLAAAAGGKLQIWDVRNLSEQVSSDLSVWSKPIMALDYNRKSNLLCVGSLDCTIKTVDPNTLNVNKFAIAEAPILSLKFLKNENRLTENEDPLLVGLKTGQIEIYKDIKQRDYNDTEGIELEDEDYLFSVKKVMKEGGSDSNNKLDSTLEKNLKEFVAKEKKQKIKQVRCYEKSIQVLTKHFRKFKFRTAFLYGLNRWYIYDNNYMEPLINCLFELERLKALSQALNNQPDQEIAKLLNYIRQFLFNSSAHNSIISSNISKKNIPELLFVIVDLLLELGYMNEENFPLSYEAFVQLNKVIEQQKGLMEKLGAMEGVLEMFINNMST